MRPDRGTQVVTAAVAGPVDARPTDMQLAHQLAAIQSILPTLMLH